MLATLLDEKMLLRKMLCIFTEKEAYGTLNILRNFVQGATIRPKNFWNDECYSIFARFFLNFSSDRCYNRSWAK